MTQQRHHHLPPEMLERAADLHVRVRAEDATAADWALLTDWLESDPRAREAYDYIEQADRFAGQHAFALAEAAAPASQEEVIAFAPRARVPRRALWMGAAAALAASIVIAVVLGPRGVPDPQIAQFVTAVGERREVSLPDGSRLTLNTGTQVDVAMTASERHITLRRGEAYFDVAKDTARPFTVAVADQEVRVVGTAYNILHHAGAVTVSVARGVVEVRSLAAPGTPPQRLTVGDRLQHVVGSDVVTLSKFSPETAATWREGRLVFKDAPLSEVVSQVNRYFTPQVRLGDQAVGDLVFSGVLQLDSPERVVGRLEGFLPIGAQSTSDGFILTRK